MKVAIQTMIVVAVLIAGIFLGLYLWPMLNPEVAPAVPPVVSETQPDTPAIDTSNTGAVVDTTRITDFMSCLKAGNTIMESYPRQCVTEEGLQFVENIGNELEKADLIRSDSPRPNSKVTSPLLITGEARGTWYFEGDFPARIEDANGKELGVVPVVAKGEWMTEDFVSFEATMNFATPDTATGSLILQKDNPSDLRENDDSLIIPISFK